MSKSKIIIVGAGLSGLTTAYKLYQQGITDFTILEGRGRIGGRIHTKDDIDLGATWFQSHHTHLSQLVKEMGIHQFDQRSSGKSVLVYNSMTPPHYFESDSSGPAAQRIADGSMALIHALAEKFLTSIALNTKVVSIGEKGNDLEVTTNHDVYQAEHVVITIPPKLARQISYIPGLPPEIYRAMETTHTWMSNAIKVGINYKTPFWRDKDLSGTIIGQIGPTIELYDHSSATDDTYSLMGFVNEGLRDSSPEDRKERILEYLEKYLGPEVRDFTLYREKDWSQDAMTNHETLKSIYMSPQYGHPAFQQAYMNGKLQFSGAETSPHYGGYMEGAVFSGFQCAKKLISICE